MQGGRFGELFHKKLTWPFTLHLDFILSQVIFERLEMGRTSEDLRAKTQEHLNVRKLKTDNQSAIEIKWLNLNDFLFVIVYRNLLEKVLEH